MNSLDFSIQQRREALVESIRKKKENEAQNGIRRDNDDMKSWDEHEPLKDQIDDSIHILVRLGYDFDTILQGSRVSRRFLEGLFEEMGYCRQKCDLDIITSNEDREEDSDTQKTDKRSIQVEIQLFMMRVQLEINKLSLTLDNTSDETRLRDSSLRGSLEKKKEILLQSFDKLFGKLAEKEDEIDINRKKTDQLRDQERSEPRERSTSAIKENVPDVLVDSGFVKIAKVCQM